MGDVVTTWSKTRSGDARLVRRRFAKSPIEANVIPNRVRHLADYFGLLDGFLTGMTSTIWFRGQADKAWALAPSALRRDSADKRRAALGLLADFRRSAALRLHPAPPPDRDLEWLQVAQHYGLPTRLLDWTENAAIALYFACLRPSKDGVVLLLNPLDLNTRSRVSPPRVLDATKDLSMLIRYLRLGEKERKNGMRTVALYPIVNTERIQLQRGTFTLHGSRLFELGASQAPSLAAIPILREDKGVLVRQLGSIGVDEMALFPDAEHICSHLKRIGGL